MFRLILGLAAAALFAQPVPVDTEMADRAKQLLESPQFKDKAWGARLAASLRLPGFEKTLIAELSAGQKYRDAVIDGPEYAYIQSLFDSLIELGAEVPAGVITPYQSRWRTEAIILLSRGRSNVTKLLEMQAESADDLEWLALSNRLLELRSPQLFERMLNGLAVTHRFFVVDGGDSGWLEFGSGPGSPPSPSRRAFPPGFPAISIHRLALSGGLGDRLLADGPRPVFLRRVLFPASGDVEWDSWTYPRLETSRTECTLEYLARLGERPLNEVRAMFKPRATIYWRDAEALTREIEKKLDEQAIDIRNLIVGTKLRGKSDASLIRVEIKPTLTDIRQKKIGLLGQPKPRELVIDMR